MADAAQNQGTPRVPGMLAGIRVIELGTVITAPLAGMMLGDLGADVIKVERPGGDPFRRSHGNLYGATFVAYNRNKRSIVLDLASPEDHDALLRLIDNADVLLDNFRPGVLARLGLDPERLHARNPRLVQCSITGFGADGPYKGRPAFDGVGQALSGIASLFIDPDLPEAFGPTISDNATGMYACYGILGALIERGRTGRGRRLEVNMLEASMAFIADAFTTYTMAGASAHRLSRVAISQSFVFRCADRLCLAIHLSTNERFWLGLVDVLGAAELTGDMRFRERSARVAHYTALRSELGRRFLARDRADWLARLAAADVPSAPVLSIAEVLADPQVQALGSKASFFHPGEGEIVAVACPVLVDGVRPKSAALAPPELGEHTDEILDGAIGTGERPA